MREVAAAMRSAATALLGSLTSEQRAAAVSPFHAAERTEWTYLPSVRPGVRVGELHTEQRELATRLLGTSYSTRGMSDAGQVVLTEAIRRHLSLGDPARPVLDRYPDLRYWLRIFGDPAGAEPWMWRLSGHHLVAQATVVGDEVAATPQFFGTEPAKVLEGPQAGHRGLPREEDLARQLVRLLEPDQQRIAITSATAPGDIKTRYDPVATIDLIDRGLGHARMDVGQRQLLEGLIGQYLDRAAPPIADRAWSELRQGGMATVQFSWAGGIDPGDPHYYAVFGPTFLLEYDNTQDDANHIHSVWRELRHDWGQDLLAGHYQSRHHEPSRYAPGRLYRPDSGGLRSGRGETSR
jgi:hypothetical protein